MKMDWMGLEEGVTQEKEEEEEEDEEKEEGSCILKAHGRNFVRAVRGWRLVEKWKRGGSGGEPRGIVSPHPYSFTRHKYNIYLSYSALQKTQNISNSINLIHIPTPVDPGRSWPILTDPDRSSFVLLAPATIISDPATILRRSCPILLDAASCV